MLVADPNLLHSGTHTSQHHGRQPHHVRPCKCRQQVKAHHHFRQAGQISGMSVSAVKVLAASHQGHQPVLTKMFGSVA